MADHTHFLSGQNKSHCIFNHTSFPSLKAMVHQSLSKSHTKNSHMHHYFTKFIKLKYLILKLLLVDMGVQAYNPSALRG